jgi:hypothetical protein
MSKKQDPQYALKVSAGLLHAARWLVLLVLVPLGVFGLGLGFLAFRQAFLSRQAALDLNGLGVTAGGGGLILAAILGILLLLVLESRVRFLISDRENTERAQDSIKRLNEWLPKDKEPH